MCDGMYVGNTHILQVHVCEKAMHSIPSDQPQYPVISPGTPDAKDCSNNVCFIHKLRPNSGSSSLCSTYGSCTLLPLAICTLSRPCQNGVVDLIRTHIVMLHQYEQVLLDSGLLLCNCCQLGRYAVMCLFLDNTIGNYSLQFGQREPALSHQYLKRVLVWCTCANVCVHQHCCLPKVLSPSQTHLKQSTNAYTYRRSILVPLTNEILCQPEGYGIGQHCRRWFDTNLPPTLFVSHCILLLLCCVRIATVVALTRQGLFPYMFCCFCVLCLSTDTHCDSCSSTPRKTPPSTMSARAPAHQSRVLERVYGGEQAVVGLIELLQRYATTPHGVKLVTRRQLLDAFTDQEHRVALEGCLTVDDNHPPSPNLVVCKSLEKHCTQEQVGCLFGRCAFWCWWHFADDLTTPSTACQPCSREIGTSAGGRCAPSPHYGLSCGTAWVLRLWLGRL